jgi:hypothetical protein
MQHKFRIELLSYLKQVLGHKGIIKTSKRNMQMIKVMSPDDKHQNILELTKSIRESYKDIIENTFFNKFLISGNSQGRISNYFQPMNRKLNYFTSPFSKKYFILHQFQNLSSFTSKLVKSTITLL